MPIHLRIVHAIIHGMEAGRVSSGDHLPSSRDLAVALGATTRATKLPGSSHRSIAKLSLDLPNITGKPTFGIAHRHLSKATVAFGNPDTRGDYDLVDMRASAILGRHIRLLGFVNNLFNEHGVPNASFAAETVPAYSGTRKRTYGLRVAWNL